MKPVKERKECFGELLCFYDDLKGRNFYKLDALSCLYGMQELVLNNGNVGFVHRFSASLNKE